MAKIVKLRKGKVVQIEVLMTGIDTVCSYQIDLAKPEDSTWKTIGEGVNNDPGSPGNDRFQLPKPTGNLDGCFLRWIVPIDALDDQGDPKYALVVSIRQDGDVVDSGLFTYMSALPKKDG